MASERLLTATPMCWIFRIMSNLLAKIGGHSRYYRRETRECPPQRERGRRAIAGLAPPPRLLRPVPWTQGDAGGSTKRPVERMGGDTPLPHPGDESGMSPVSGTAASGRKFASLAEWNPPRAR